MNRIEASLASHLQTWLVANVWICKWSHGFLRPMHLGREVNETSTGNNVEFGKRCYYRYRIDVRRRHEQRGPHDFECHPARRMTSAAVAAAVEKVGGEVTHELGIINAVVADLSPSQIDELRRLPVVSRLYPNRSR